MSETRDNRAKEIFLDALDLAEDEVAAHLAAACGSDESLRAKVDGLLAAHERSTDIEALASFPANDEPEPQLTLVGDYELFEELGRGAAGTVYRARQRSLDREVAVKVLRAGSLASEMDVRRFRREAEAAAALDHPGIVPVYDIGEVDDHYFFSMKRVDGPSLDAALDRFAGDPRAAGQLTATVARAVHHAHNRGVLHRDIKPSNILLDASGEPHVADFGIARPLGGARLTQTGFVAGTPAYMSPEQAMGTKDVTVAADVWSLGCVLYELVAGKPPFGGDGIAQVLRRVQEAEPERLTGVDRDLATVISVALAKDPARRYPSALAFAEDIDRWVQHQPIAARPATRIERFRLMCRRSPVAATLGIAVALLLLILGTGAGAASLVLRHRLQETREANDIANERLRAALVANSRAERRSEIAGRRARGLEFLEQAAAIETGPDLRDEAITTLTLKDLVARTAWDTESKFPIAVDDAFEHVAIMVPRGVELRHPESGELLAEIQLEGAAAKTGLYTNRDQHLWLRRFAGTNLSSKAALEVWDVAATPPARIHERAVASRSMTRSPEGRTIALARADGVIELIDSASFTVLHELPAVSETPERMAFRPDGEALAVATGKDFGVEVISLRDGSSLASLEFDAHVLALAWSPDGELLVVGCFDQLAYVWDTTTWKQRSILRGHEGEVVEVAVLPGHLAATTAWDGTTRIWDADIGVEILRTTAHVFAFDRAGRRGLQLTEGQMGVAELVVDDVLRVLHAHEGKSPKELAESSDRRYLATAGDASWILWNAQTFERLAVVPTGMVHSVAFDPMTDEVITSGEDGLLRWEIAHGEVQPPEVLVDSECRRCDVSPDGRWIAVVNNGALQLLDRNGGQREMGRHSGLDRVTFTADGRLLAVGTWGGKGLRVWDTETGELLTHLEQESGMAMAAFTPDGTLVAVTTFDGNRIYRTDTWEVVHDIPREGPRRPSAPAAFSDDGSIMAVSVTPGAVRLLRTPPSGQWNTLADLKPAQPLSLFHMRFLDEGRKIGIATPSHRLLIWRLDQLWDELAGRGLVEEVELPFFAVK